MTAPTLGVLATGPDWSGPRPDVRLAAQAGAFVRVGALVPGDRRALDLARTAEMAGARVLLVYTHPNGQPAVPPSLSVWLALAQQIARQRPAWDWEIWNEPNGQDQAAFADLIVRTVHAIKSVNSGATITGCGFHGAELLRVGSWSQTFLEQHADALRSLDAISVHLIRPRNVRATVLRQAQALLRLLAPLGKPVWLTEVGYSSNPVYQEARYRGGERAQAAWLLDTLPALREMGFSRVVWSLLADGRAGFADHGLVRSDGTLKPSWFALRGLL